MAGVVAQVALAWAMAKPGVTSPLIGARTVEQLTGNLTAAPLTLDHEQMARLDEVSAPPPGFSAGLASLAIRRMYLEVAMFAAGASRGDTAISSVSGSARPAF
ncbi:aldo/keto reductase [Sphingomonas sp. 2SG]|uniref:aldo/keto reductase n=1 Tax=Sphingomonas sp. 2SG TaxID=2502201 RepID=UPI002016A3B6|nr:aldo/keto reductase [Sphingomonas sp. 2SG]